MNATQVLCLDVSAQCTFLVGAELAYAARFRGGLVLSPEQGLMFGMHNFASGEVLRVAPLVRQHAREQVSSIEGYGKENGFDGFWYRGVFDPQTQRLFVVPGGGGATQVLVFDPKTGIRKLVGPKFTDEESGKHKFSGACFGEDGLIYGVPCTAKRMIQIDPVNETVVEVGPDLSEGNVWKSKWRSGVVANGCIYALPAAASKVLKFDLKAQTAKFLETGLEEGGVHKYTSAAVANDNNVYGIPACAEKVIKIDTKTDTVSFVGDDLPAESHGLFKYGGTVLGQDGRLYGIPAMANNVLTFSVEEQAGFPFGPDLGPGYKYQEGK